MYTQSARYYDALYRSMRKDYAREARMIAEIVERRKTSPGNELLDIACGTGLHIAELRNRFACEGLDLDRGLLNIAAERNPGITFHLADMIGFNLGKKFDAITCLFSAIGYVPNAGRLTQTLQTFARHLKPGGVVLVEPWFPPERWIDGHLSALFVDEPDVKAARMSISRRDGNVAVLNFHYMVASSDGVRTFTETHRLTLFTHDEHMEAFRKAGFTVEHDPEGPMGRGLYIGTRP
ncbi:MAG: class I SAM-dependent methyltransferase [Candidatus Eremiobacteraeota bacterium]|nr:class I SAM-dependent methyltransferase [Candidatus Eremiobacteraeota bacterium]